MGRRGRATAAAAVAGLVVAAVLVALAWPVRPVLRLSHGEDVLADLSLPDDVFTIRYVHSIDRLPIEEDVQVTGDRLVVQTTRVRQFGAGMGQIAGEGRGYADPPWWVVTDLHRDIGTELLLRVGASGVDHRVRTADGTELALSQCWAGERIRISVERVPLLAPPQHHQRHPAPCRPDRLDREATP